MRVFTRASGQPPLPRLFVIFGRIHVFQNQFTGLGLTPFMCMDNIRVKPLDRLGNFSHAPCQRGGNRNLAIAPVHSGQRLDAPLSPWNQNISMRTQRARKQPGNPFCGKIRQVAGDDQIPRQVRSGQGGRDSREWTQPNFLRSVESLRGNLVRDDVQPERCVSRRRTDNRYVGDEWRQQARGMQNQRDAAEIEKSLVAPHARAGAPCKNKSGDLGIALHGYPAILRRRAELAQSSGEL